MNYFSRLLEFWSPSLKRTRRARRSHTSGPPNRSQRQARPLTSPRDRKKVGQQQRAHLLHAQHRPETAVYRCHAQRESICILEKLRDIDEQQQDRGANSRPLATCATALISVKRRPFAPQRGPRPHDPTTGPRPPNNLLTARTANWPLRTLRTEARASGGRGSSPTRPAARSSHTLLPFMQLCTLHPPVIPSLAAAASALVLSRASR